MAHMESGHTDPRAKARYDKDIAAARVIGMVQALITTESVHCHPDSLASLKEWLADYEEAERRQFDSLFPRAA